MKRAIDLTLSLLLLVLLSPILFFVSMLIFINMGSPIFFIQERLGLGNSVIKLYKFRTMTNKRDDLGNLLSNEERVTRLGRFLRKSSIDELPSLLNVLKGDLSLVGPRPLLIRYQDVYKEKHKARHQVRPGITGLAQVNGRNATTWHERLDFDVKYVRSHSLFLDFKILLLTAYKVLKREGVEGSNDLSIIPLDKDTSYLDNDND